MGVAVVLIKVYKLQQETTFIELLLLPNCQIVGATDGDPNSYSKVKKIRSTIKIVLYFNLIIDR